MIFIFPPAQFLIYSVSLFLGGFFAGEAALTWREIRQMKKAREQGQDPAH